MVGASIRRHEQCASEKEIPACGGFVILIPDLPAPALAIFPADMPVRDFAVGGLEFLGVPLHRLIGANG